MDKQQLIDEIDRLIPSDKYPLLNDFAKSMPESFYIDDRVKIANRREIYKVVKELAEIKRNERRS